MRREASYLLVLLFSVPIFAVFFGSELLLLWFPGIPSHKYQRFVVFSYAWLGGGLGGTLFSLKWLYHSRAKGTWHCDRSFWRYFTPHLSAGLAFSFSIILASGLLRVFSQHLLDDPILSLGVGFLTGYFSDSAVAKLTEVAETIFGTNSLRHPDRTKAILNSRLDNSSDGETTQSLNK